MELNEAITHLEESLADPSHDWGCEECKKEHEQLLEWLQHYQRLTGTGIQDNGDKIPGYSYTYITDIMGVPHIHINSVRSMLEKAVEEHDKLLRSAEGHHQIGQDVPRKRAEKCEHYTEEKYDRDEMFVL